MVITIYIWFELPRFGKDFSVCILHQKSLVSFRRMLMALQRIQKAYLFYIRLIKLISLQAFMDKNSERNIFRTPFKLNGI